MPILGVCLGHQAIGQAFGAEVVPARRIVHGKTEEMSLDGRGLFRGLPRTAKFTRYHSLVLERDSLPPELEVTAASPDGEIMGVRHRTHVVEGSSSIPSPLPPSTGKRCLRNFLRYRREPFPLSGLIRGLQQQKAMSREEAEAFMDELTDGQLTDVADRRSPRLPDGEAHHPGGAGGVRLRAAAQEEAVCKRPQGAGHLRDGRRRAGHVQHLLPGGNCGGLLRGARGKARQPGGKLAVRKRRLLPGAGGSRGRPAGGE